MWLYIFCLCVSKGNAWSVEVQRFGLHLQTFLLLMWCVFKEYWIEKRFSKKGWRMKHLALTVFRHSSPPAVGDSAWGKKRGIFLTALLAIHPWNWKHRSSVKPRFAWNNKSRCRTCVGFYWPLVLLSQLLFFCFWWWSESRLLQEWTLSGCLTSSQPYSLLGTFRQLK